MSIKFLSHKFNLSNMSKKTRKSSKKPVVISTPRVPNYLAIPKDEDDWIRYRGGCNIFAGKFMEDDMWVMESEDETKTKLADALKLGGIKCETISFGWEDTKDGVRNCIVICSYNQPYEPYYDDFYLPGITGFDFEYLEKDPSLWQLEFTLYEVL